MIAFLLSPIGKIAGAAALLVAAFFAFRVWLATHDAQVLQGYVLVSEKIAAEAQLAEVKRQLDAGKIVIASYTEVAKNARKQEAETSAEAEKRIKDYEEKLVSLGRSCSLSDADIIELLHNQ